jgi:steroid delta-isomerase-like uncharacterized protein
MTKWKRGAMAAALTAATAAILAGASLAANAQTATTKSASQPAKPQSHKPVAANIKVVESFLQNVLNDHHGDLAASYMNADMQFHAGTVGSFTGRATVAAVLGGIVTAIPDLHASVQDIFGHGDEVVVRLVVTGTQKGPLLGIPTSGRRVQWDAIDLYRLQGGKLSEEWASEDLTAILDDTGTYKAPWIP